MSRGGLAPSDPYAVEATEDAVLLGPDLSTQLTLTRPADTRRDAPLVVLVHDQGPLDRDHTLDTADGPVPHFALLAQTLSRQGFAVARYDQRHVRPPGRVDRPRYTADQDTTLFRDDLVAVLDHLDGRDGIDGAKTFLIGVGEGAAVALAAAQQRPVAGVVLIGAPATSWRALHTARWRTGTLPYLERFAYRGMLDGVLLGRAIRSAAAPPYLDQARALATSRSRAGGVVELSPAADADRDGILALQTELLPAIPELVGFAFGPLGGLAYLERDGALPPPIELLGNTPQPVLALYGEHAARVPIDHAPLFEERLIATGNPDGTVLRIPGVGHLLGPATDPVDDLDRPADAATWSPLITWLVSRASR